MSTKKVAKTKALRAVIYVRISKDRAGAGLGVQRQEDECRKLAKRLGVTVIGLYLDNDLGATNPNTVRPDYQRLLADMRAGLIDVVLVWHTDRLHRRPIELEEFIEVAEGQRPIVTVQAVQAGMLDLASPGGRMAARMLGNAAKYEMEIKSERHKAANLQAAQSGLPRGGLRPFGFEDDKITHRPREAKAIKAAAKAVIAGETLYELARQWNAQGLTSSVGREWTAATMGQLLRRPRNAGLREYNGEIIGKAVWKPIIDEQMWNALQAVLTNPARRTNIGTRPRWLLSGIARCGFVYDNGEHCPYTMTAGMVTASSYRTSKPRSVYKCRTGGHLARSADPLDDFIKKLTIARLSLPDAAKLLVDEKNIDLTKLHDEARQLRARQDALAVQAATGQITPVQMATINQIITSELAKIDAQIASAAQSNVLVDLIGIEDIEYRWEHKLSLPRKRAIIDTLMTLTVLPVGRGAGQYFDPDGIRVEWRKPGDAAPPRRRTHGAPPRSGRATGSGALLPTT